METKQLLGDADESFGESERLLDPLESERQHPKTPLKNERAK